MTDTTTTRPDPARRKGYCPDDLSAGHPCWALPIMLSRGCLNLHGCQVSRFDFFSFFFLFSFCDTSLNLGKVCMHACIVELPT